MDANWYEKSFQEDYTTLYQHRDELSAQREISSLLQHLPLPRSGKVLDLCCGDGRHSRALASHGYDVTGVDLSSYLLERAKQKSKEYHISFYQYDMREIPFVNEFDILFNLFTSFGYFIEDEEHQKVAQRMARALKPSGYLVMDFLNPIFVKENLIPYSEREVEGMKIEERRKIENEFVIKEIRIIENGEERKQWERVRLYSEDQMRQILNSAGFIIHNVYGDYDFTPYSSESKRMILYGQRQK
ncbi:class I SAM-dependent methyltransferase [Aneurinibacillus terranovensis]|uniref:class I SAM-dependent methyltransferase n=1 Tax=Aneurinibacillus terranovensis TaxID=278991 RepID=UPI000410E299|nr:class I SAM-dependent methyltransferase [Aneurinibacillus terranovensis]